MTDLSEVEAELKTLIIETLMLEDVTPASIVSTDPLFVDGLGLDSIDALELAMAIDQRWRVSFDAEDDKNREIFASVRNLAQYVIEQVAQQ